jgi:regulator of protease activity HflC (stomatin/prohibitin superfamily)
MIAATSSVSGSLIAIIIVVGVVAMLVISTIVKGVKTIDQATVGVVTLFGKYRRIINPGLNFVLPWFEQVKWHIAVQNQTSQLEFVAITQDQASVHFKATLTFAVTDHLPETIQLVAFKFIDDGARTRAMTSAVEASVREFVSTHQQIEVLGLRSEIATHAKDTLKEQLAGWGFTLNDLSINDITFDKAVMDSMSRVVVATNSQKAAEFEGAALLIKRTKEAEADGATIRITAENEATAAKLRGEGLAAFRVAVSTGLGDSADLLVAKGVDPGVLLLTLWTESLENIVKNNSGNTIFLDGNLSTLENTTRRLQAITSANGKDDAPTGDKPAASSETDAQPVTAATGGAQ